MGCERAGPHRDRPVSHSGDRADGEFATPYADDIHTAWTETQAVLGKSQAFVVDALEQIRRRLPFELRAIDSDNGSEFINHHLRGPTAKRSISSSLEADPTRRTTTPTSSRRTGLTYGVSWAICATTAPRR